MAQEAPETSAVITMSCKGRFVESAALAQNPSALLQPADALLHKAKREGRNQVWAATLKRRSGHFECPRRGGRIAGRKTSPQKPVSLPVSDIE